MKLQEKRRNIKVLMYHRIISSKSPEEADYFAVTEENFRQQLQVMDALNFTPITFEDYHLYQEGKLTLPRKPIIITFDDGHCDMIETALPVLQEFNMKAVVFVMGDRRIRYAEWDQKNENNACPLLTDEQVLQLRKEGFEIGAHSMTHPSLTELSFPELKNEIMGSKRAIESLLGERIFSFAYPYGRVNKKVEATVAKAGFKYGCGVYTGPPQFGDSDFDIRRLALNIKTSSFQFILKLVTPYEYLEWVYGKIRNNNKINGTLSNGEASVKGYEFKTSTKTQ